MRKALKYGNVRLLFSKQGGKRAARAVRIGSRRDYR